MDGKMGRLSLEGETEEKATAAMKSSMVNEAKVGPVVGWLERTTPFFFLSPFARLLTPHAGFQRQQAMNEMDGTDEKDDVKIQGRV